MHLWVNEGAILMAKICFQAAQNTITLKYNFHEPQNFGGAPPMKTGQPPSHTNPYTRLQAVLCKSHALKSNQLLPTYTCNGFLLLYSICWRILIYLQATYILTNIPTCLPLLMDFSFLITFLPPSQCVPVHWPILHSILLFFNFLLSESGNTQGD